MDWPLFFKINIISILYGVLSLITKSAELNHAFLRLWFIFLALTLFMFVKILLILLSAFAFN